MWLGSLMETNLYVYVQNALSKYLGYDEAISDNGCSRHMTDNKDFLVEFKEMKNE